MNGPDFSWAEQKFTYGNPSSVTYSSGPVGKIQGEAEHVFDGLSVANTVFEYPDDRFPYRTSFKNDNYQWDFFMKSDTPSSLKHFSGNLGFGFNYLSTTRKGDVEHPVQYYWYQSPKHYRYRLVASSSGSGEDATTTYSLEEYTTGPDADEGYSFKGFWGQFAVSDLFSAPYDEKSFENRPINIAVRYFIRAR